jgi:glyoxylate reductase
LAHVFVTRPLPGRALDRLRQAHEVEVWSGPLPPTQEQLAERAARADALISLPSDLIDAALLRHCPQLKAIANYAVGYDNIDLLAATERGIQVGNTPDVLTEATADLTFALLLAVARRLVEAAAAVRAGRWLTWEPERHLGVELNGTTLGIVGLGRIGRAVARRAEGFGMNILSVNSKSGRDAFEQLLEQADFVSLHAPLTPQTRRIIDRDALRRMKRTAILINTGRGGLVDQPALIEALRDGVIAGAALDVTDPEPPPAGDPILTAHNLLLTPHIGSATHAARERMAEIAVDNVLAALSGRPMPHPVTR